MEEGENKQGHGDLGSAISEARKYASLMAQIEVELEGQVIELEGQVGQLETDNRLLREANNRLWDEKRKAESNCPDPDSPEVMAGDLPPPTNPDGSPS